MKKNLLKLLFAILILSSCTVHKRLHQPGWDINFRGNWKMIQEKQIATTLDTLSIQKIDFQEGQANKQSVTEIHYDGVNPTINRINENALLSIHKENNTKPTRQLYKSFAKQVNKHTFNKAEQLKSKKTDTREGNIIGAVFMLIGLLIFIIGLSIYLSADVTLAGSIYLILSIIGMAIGSIFFLMGLILLLTLLITKGVVKNEQRLKQQAKETEKTSLEESSNNGDPEVNTETPIEEAALMPEKTENKSKNLLIIGGAVLVLSLIYLVIKAN